MCSPLVCIMQLCRGQISLETNCLLLKQQIEMVSIYIFIYTTFIMIHTAIFIFLFWSIFLYCCAWKFLGQREEENGDGVMNFLSLQFVFWSSCRISSTSVLEYMVCPWFPLSRLASREVVKCGTLVKEQIVAINTATLAAAVAACIHPTTIVGVHLTTSEWGSKCCGVCC